MERNFRPNFTYQNFASQFTAELFDPTSWAELVAASGARYVVLTSKHHEGYTNWPSAFSPNWNSMDVGPKRDLVGEYCLGNLYIYELLFYFLHSERIESLGITVISYTFPRLHIDIIMHSVTGDLAKAFRSKAPHVHFGLYHSMFEWFNPLFLEDKENNFSTNVFAKTKTIPELYELVSDNHVVTMTKLLRKDDYSKTYP